MPEFDTTQHVRRCLDRLAAGDAAARDELLAAAADRLQRLARSMLRDFPGVRRWEETADVAQNAAVRLWRALAEVRPAAPLDFFRLAALNIRRELIDLARHHRGPEGAGAHHASSPPGADAPAHERAADPRAADRLDAWAAFHEHVGRLPAEEREAFDLLWYQGLSQAEAAALLGVSERTVKRRWQAARVRVHDAMGGEVPG